MEEPQSGSKIAGVFTRYASQRLQKSLNELERCVAQLNEKQMSMRGGEHENSVVNLLVHLEGNLRQWILHGVADQPDHRMRDEEFALDVSTSGHTAMARLRETIQDACAIVSSTTADRLLEITDPQPTNVVRHCTVLEAIAKTFGHLEHHTGQVILLTKQYAGRDLDLSVPRKR
jgi:uncharacterized damage-inducible protein DinB